MYLAARILPKIALWEDAQTISYESTGALYRRRVFSAQTSTPAAQWNWCYTYPVLADPFRGSRRERRPPSGPEGPGIFARRIGRRRSGPAPPATRPNPTTYGGPPRLPAGEAPRRDMIQAYCAGKVHENGRKSAQSSTTELGIRQFGRSAGFAGGRPKSRVGRRACTVAFGLHQKGRLDPSPSPVCVPGRGPGAGHQQHNGVSVTPIRFWPTGPMTRRQVARPRRGRLPEAAARLCNANSVIEEGILKELAIETTAWLLARKSPCAARPVR